MEGVLVGVADLADHAVTFVRRLLLGTVVVAAPLDPAATESAGQRLPARELLGTAMVHHAEDVRELVDEELPQLKKTEVKPYVARGTSTYFLCAFVRRRAVTETEATREHLVDVVAERQQLRVLIVLQLLTHVCESHLVFIRIAGTLNGCDDSREQTKWVHRGRSLADRAGYCHPESNIC